MLSITFDLDAGNKDKNWEKHGVSDKEAESVFYDHNLQVRDEIRPSDSESRYALIGKSAEGRLLRVVFTYRDDKVRIISARRPSRKERSRLGLA